MVKTMVKRNSKVNAPQDMSSPASTYASVNQKERTNTLLF